jgi:tetratricopeptide (TPR) repeat protein
MKQLSRFFLPLLILTSPLVVTSTLEAQRQANPGGGNTGGNPGTVTPGAGSPTTPSRPQQQPNISQPQNQPETQMPIFLSGKVVMDDGSPPPANISIQRICTNTPHTVAYTDSKGRFNFQWGVSSGIIPDASENTSMIGGNRTFDDAPAGMNSRNGIAGMNSMMGCQVAANAPGFRSEAIDLGSHRAMDNPDLGTIVLHRLANVEGTSVSATSLNAPKDAKKAWEKGVQLLHKNKTAEASAELEKAVALYPKYANAWLDLGRARVKQKQTDPAREAFLKAIDADGKLVEPYIELGEMAARREDWPESARYLDRALQLDPVDFPQLWFEDAVASYNMKEYDRAEKNAREALKLDSNHRNPRANQLLGLILINKHDYTGAGAALRTYVQLAPNAQDLDQVKAQLLQLDNLRPSTQP